MKIDPSRIDPLFQQEQTQKKSSSTAAGGFDELLEQAAQETSLAAGMPPLGASAAFDPRFITDAAGGLDAADALSAAAFFEDDADKAASDLDGLLGEMDAYVQELGSGDNSRLRGAYNRLEGIESRLQALKADPAAARVLADNQGLAAMVNEMEVLATTEKFKFNRGDYI